MFYINENEIDELDKYGYDSTGEYLLGRLNLSHTKFFDTREEAAFYQYKEALRLEKIAKQQADEAIIKSKKFYNKYREDIEKQTDKINEYNLIVDSIKNDMKRIGVTIIRVEHESGIPKEIKL
jgi:hypothetical protein